MNFTAALLVRGLVLNLEAGLRLATFLPLSRYDFRVSPADFVLLWAFNLLAWLAGGMLRGGFPGYVDFAALPAALAEIPLVLLACLIIAALYRRRELLLALALFLISPGALFELVSSVITFAESFAGAEISPTYQLAADAAYFSWMIAVAVRALWVAAGWRRWQFIYGSALLVVSNLLLLNYMPRTELWAAYEDVATDAAQSPILQEDLFHAQGGLLEANLTALRPQRAGVADLYFVGFAPYGTQDVFGKELHTVSRLMRERFDAAGRTLLLSNDAATLGDLPIASATNLRAALEHLGRIMDADEDALFLYISTHGSEDGELAVELEPLDLMQIRPAALAAMLHDSGIKWRVLVISACYSGGFIEALKDENTLIVTPTDAKSQSFGCDNGEDFTWFGRAYFDEALRRTRSFSEAFDIARQTVAQREREQKFPPSEPQIFVGAAIKGKLAALQQRLDSQ